MFDLADARRRPPGAPSTLVRSAAALIAVGLSEARRTRPATRAARAALAPHAPCTPPPGCADADARNRPRTGVSARPSPGTGRNTSCWENAIVPPPSAPPTRLALRASSAGGRQEVPAGDQRAEAGRVLLDLGLDAVGERLRLAVVPACR